MSEMAERLAKVQYDRASFRIQQRCGVHCISWGALNYEQQKSGIEDALAMIDAMHEPTESMLNAGILEQRGTYEIWQAMIDQALK
jgi:hypothetical protein